MGVAGAAIISLQADISSRESRSSLAAAIKMLILKHLTAIPAALILAVALLKTPGWAGVLARRTHETVPSP